MHSAQRSNVGSGNYERGSGAGRVAIHFIWLIMLLSLFCMGSRAEAADLTIFGPNKYELQKGKQTVYTDRFGDGSNSTKAQLRVQNGNDPRTSIKHVRVYINDRQVLSRKDFRRKKQTIEKEISIKGSNSIKVVLKRGCRSYWRLLGEYEARDERTNKELERLALLKKEIENLIATLKKSGDISSSRLEALSRDIHNLAGHSEGRQGHFSGIGRSLDDDFDGDDDFDNDDDDDIREPGRERITHERELLERYGREIHDFHGLCNDLGNRFHGKDAKVKRLLPQLMSQLKELEERIEKEIKILAEIEEKLEALRKRGAPFITVEIHKQGSSDVTPPTISLPQPTDGALLAHARPAISAAYADNAGGSGIDPATVKVTLDSSDITSMCAVTASGVSCAPTSNLVDGTHSVTVAVSDIAKNPASYSWRFTTDTTPPRATVTSPQSGQNLGNSRVTVTGAVDDPAATITVNGTAATLTGLTYSVADVPLTEGVNTIAVIARDPAGNQSVTSINVTLDTSLPVVTITAPIDASFTNIPTITVSGQVNETPAAVTINGRAATLTGSTFVLENMPLAEGQNSITALATDLAGNKGAAVATVTLDTANPQIFVTAPANGLLTRNPQLTITGTVSEPLTSLTVTSTPLSAGTSKPVTLNGLAFETALALNEGVNTITLEGLDRAGNKGAATITVTLDSTPPLAPVLEALPVVTNNPNVTLRGSAEAGNSVVLYVGDTNAGQTVADQTGLFTFAGITLTEGTNIFTAASLDLAGNTSRISETIGTTLDTKAPAVTITTPLDKMIVNTPAITVSGTIDDPSAQVTVNGLPAINSGGIWTLEGVTLQEGINTLLVEARDPAGNKGSASATVVLDTVPPVVTITTPVDGMYTNIVQVTVTGKTNEEVASVTVTSALLSTGNGTSATITTTSPASSTFTAPLILTEGINTIVVTAVDKAGNTGSATVTVILDTIAPQLTVIGPTDGALLNNGQITFGGSAAEPVVSVLINGIAAQAGANGGYTLPLTLAEGNNNLTVTAIDRAGNSSTSTIAVTLDSTPPAAPLLDALPTPTRTATTPLSGQAEANSTVKLFNNGVLIATLTVDAAGQFSAAEVTLTEGTNPFTAQATDAAGNASPLSAPLTVALDTKPPVITVTAPQPGMVISAVQVTITGTVDEPLASLMVNGGAATLNGNTFEYVMTLAAGDNSALITATDLAGNVATTTVTIQRDFTPPKVVIVAPLSGLLTNNPQIQVSGTVDDAEATLTLLGAPISVTNKAFTVGYLLIDGDNNIQVKAVDKAGNEGTSTVTVILDAQAPVVTLSAPATATAGTDVQITVTATDNRSLTLVDLSADGASLWSAAPTGATASQTVSLRLSPALAPGTTVTVRARALDAAANSGSATAVITIDKAADGPGWLQGKALDDSRGLPLEGGQVSVTDAKGVQQTITTPADGAWFFELASGAAKVEVTKSGFTTVRRDVTVRPGQRTSVLDSRLTRIDGTVHTVDATGGVVGGAGLVPAQVLRIAIPANALSTQADVRLTPVSNQGLIMPLPLGWSPLAVADLRLIDPITAALVDPQPLAAPASLTLPLPTGLGDIALTAELTRYDTTSRTWVATADVAIAAKATTATAQINQPGQYALVLADPMPLNPPAPIAGQELAAATLSATDFSLITTTGRVVPQAAPPSVGLRAAGDLLLVAKPDAATAPALISGLIVNARVSEKFDLTSGAKLQPASTLQDIVLYRTACATSIAGGATEPPFDSAQGSALRTTFPVSPSRDFTIVDLLLGKITVDITQPDTSGGVMVGADGARLLQPDGTALSIPAGALTGSVPVTVATLPEAAVSSLVGADFRLLRGVDIAITGQTLKSSATLSIPAPAGFDPALPVVVAKKFDVKGGSKLKLVAAAKLSGSIINSEPLTPELTTSTNSINSSGQYLFLQATAPIGYVAGQITDAAAAAFAGIQVTAQSATLADLTGIDGHYLLALAAGSQTVTALDPTRGDAASGTVAITANTKSTLNLAVRMVPPTVTSITPANGAINVQPDVPVVVTFSKPMDKTTVTASTLKLTNSTITWNAEATVATIYPAEAFTQEKTYNVTISATVKDVQGYSLGQDVASIFTVRRTTAPAMPAAGAISGTFPDADGYITVTGTQGSAAADNTVLLINDTTGEIQSVTPVSNGSFSGKVRGQLGDQIKVVLMDYSGNQTTISYLTFKGPDGSYLVTAKGGKIEGEGGSLLDVPEGALVGPAVIKVTALSEANLPSPVPDKGVYLAGFNIDTGGVGFQKEVHLSIPVPNGFDPKTPVFVTKPSEVYNADGTVEKVYEVIDSTKIVNGRITTASPPFDGIMTLGSYVFTAFPTITVGIVSGYTYQDMNDIPGYQPTSDGSVETPLIDASGNPVYKYDRPIKGAVIRTPAAWNYVSYSNSSGFYAGFTTLFVDVDVSYTVTATHPLTMKRESITGYLNANSNIISKLNFKLAEKSSIQPDKTAPVIDMSLQVASGQPPENRISSGVMPLGTELTIPVAITDQSAVTATMTVVAGSQINSAALVMVGKTLVSAQTSDKPAIWRYSYQPTFSADVKGSQPFNFKPQVPGVYQITVDATDSSNNKSSKKLQVRVVTPDTIPGGADGPPIVDYVTPLDGDANLLVNTVVSVWFSEPVDNVNDSTFKLIDTTTGLQVPAALNTSFGGGRMQVDLIPRGNLAYDRSYQVIITTAIVDVYPNPSADNAILPLAAGRQITFTTKRPSAYDLDADDQFSGGRDIALFNNINNGGSYAYVAAGDKGWRVIDVVKPDSPEVVRTYSSTCASGNPDCTWRSPYFSYRGVAVHPDPNRAILALTENIVYPDNAQYGYIRFYDLAADSINPPIVGQEKLAEEYSGIPGRVALSGDYAYVATAAAALQVISISTAIDNIKNHRPTNEGSSIVGVFDSIGQGYGSPNDIYIYGPGKALLTTNPGHLLVLDINNPIPVLTGLLESSKLGAFRVAGTTDYPYTDSFGNPQTMDLAVTGGNGRIKTVDLSDPYNPKVLATAKDAAGSEVVSYPYDVTINKATGLAIVTTLSAIQVIDIKDPKNPRLLNTITQLPDTSGATTAAGMAPMLPIGSIFAMVESNGWLYMADENKGMRMLELGGEVKRACNPDYPCSP